MGPTVYGLRGHVADAQAAGAATEAAIGDQSAVRTPAGARHGPGDSEHLPHAGPAFGPS